jgi:sortase A
VGLVLALLLTLQPVSGAQPVAIDIPKLHVSATVVPLGLEDDGAMAAPADPDTVGWFEPGAGVGAPGNVLLDGHVDWGGRLRVFGRLHQLAVGDTITIVEAAGAELRYSVAWTRFYADAESAPLDEIYLLTDAAEALTLITCGGTFDESISMYRGRWIVRAVRDELVSED